MTKCAKCGKDYPGYDDINMDVIDGRYYCKTCHAPAPYIQHCRDEPDVCFYSFADILKIYGGTIKDYARIYQKSYDWERWAIHEKDGETWVDSGFIFHNSHSAHHIAVVYGKEVPSEIKDMEIINKIDTTYEIADPTLKFVCGNCRNARYKGERKGAESGIYCVVRPDKKITPTAQACIDINNRSSVFNSSFNPIGKGGRGSGYNETDKNNCLTERLVE